MDLLSSHTLGCSPHIHWELEHLTIETRLYVMGEGWVWWVRSRNAISLSNRLVLHFCLKNQISPCDLRNLKNLNVTLLTSTPPSVWSTVTIATHKDPSSLFLVMPRLTVRRAGWIGWACEGGYEHVQRFNVIAALIPHAPLDMMKTHVLVWFDVERFTSWGTRTWYDAERITQDLSQRVYLSMCFPVYPCIPLFSLSIWPTHHYVSSFCVRRFFSLFSQSWSFVQHSPQLPPSAFALHTRAHSPVSVLTNSLSIPHFLNMLPDIIFHVILRHHFFSPLILFTAVCGDKGKGEKPKKPKQDKAAKAAPVTHSPHTHTHTE